MGDALLLCFLSSKTFDGAIIFCNSQMLHVIRDWKIKKQERPTFCLHRSLRNLENRYSNTQLTFSWINNVIYIWIFKQDNIYSIKYYHGNVGIKRVRCYRTMPILFLFTILTYDNKIFHQYSKIFLFLDVKIWSL